MAFSKVAFKEGFIGQSLVAGVAKPFSSMCFDFMAIPIVPSIKQSIGFQAILERADIRSKIPIYMFSQCQILAYEASCSR